MGSPSLKKECSNCRHYLSYEDEYDDPLEPWECGTCRVDPKDVKPTASEDTCDKFEFAVGVTTS